MAQHPVWSRRRARTRSDGIIAFWASAAQSSGANSANCEVDVGHPGGVPKWGGCAAYFHSTVAGKGERAMTKDPQANILAALPPAGGAAGEVHLAEHLRDLHGSGGTGPQTPHGTGQSTPKNGLTQNWYPFLRKNHDLRETSNTLRVWPSGPPRCLPSLASTSPGAS